MVEKGGLAGEEKRARGAKPALRGVSRAQCGRTAVSCSSRNLMVAPFRVLGSNIHGEPYAKCTDVVTGSVRSAVGRRMRKGSTFPVIETKSATGESVLMAGKQEYNIHHVGGGNVCSYQSNIQESPARCDDGAEMQLTKPSSSKASQKTRPGRKAKCVVASLPLHA